MKILAYAACLTLNVWSFVRMLDATSWSFVGVQMLIGVGAGLALAIGRASRD